MTINPPIKPFPTYKWKWATLTCTEGLNEPAVYLGVLRAMRTHEGCKPSDPDLLKTLEKVEHQTDTDVALARSAKRNLLRNSGQYWRALNLMMKSRGGIELTEFGRKVADSNITPTEFATITINTLTLPNPRIDDKHEAWGNLRIKPLQLILQILAALHNSFGSEETYITPTELIKITIPLAGESAPMSKHVHALTAYRQGKLDILGWPDCALDANDRRMAREFLLFLAHYGFCSKILHSPKRERYYLSAIEPQEINALANMKTDMFASDAAEKIIDSELPAAVERKRVMIRAFARPNQAKFRADVLNAFNHTCFLTGVQLPAVLEAAHIVPVSNNGMDTIENALCLRVDIHRLFDSGHLRISVEGNLHLSDSAALKQNYGSLPSSVTFPQFSDLNHIEWRWNYT